MSASKKPNAAVTSRGAAQDIGAPQLARAERLDRPTRLRIEQALDKRRAPEFDAKVGGALRALAPLSPELVARAESLAVTLERQQPGDHALLLACVWALAEAGRSSEVLPRLIAAGDERTASYLPCAAWNTDPALTPLLARLSSAASSTALFAEAARVYRGEANGARLTELATRAKESVRLAFAERMLHPLSESTLPTPRALLPALAVLRTSERHLGRWLVLGELALRSGDGAALEEAHNHATRGPDVARSGWALVAWALIPTAPPPALRTTKLSLELLARLSPRPSAERDMSFLLRMGRHGIAEARAPIESWLRQEIPTVMRARLLSLLAGPYAEVSALDQLRRLAVEAKDEHAGLWVAGLWDACQRHPVGVDASTVEVARELAAKLVLSKHISNVAWGALIRDEEQRVTNTGRRGWVLTDQTVRLLHGAAGTGAAATGWVS